MASVAPDRFAQDDLCKLVGRMGAQGSSFKTSIETAFAAERTKSAVLAAQAVSLQATLDTTPTLPNLRTACDAVIAALAAAA
jgi:hypothetical protein